MPRGQNIAALRALKLERKETKRAKNQAASALGVDSRSQNSPLDLSEPQANTDFLDIPCTPVAPTTPAAAEAFETPAATLIEADAAEHPPSADDDAEKKQDRPKQARKSSEIMNVSVFPTNWKWTKKEEVVVSTDTLGNALFDEQLLLEGIQQLREGCPGCGEHSRIDFQESVARGLGGHLKFTCTNKKCLHETKINKSKMMPGLNAAGKPCAPKAMNTARGVAAFKAAGIGQSNANQFLLGMDLPSINTNVWAAHGETYSAATKTYLDRIFLENIEKEKIATLLHEGDSCRTSDGKVKIKVMTDGSWQKRYGRNSLYGIGAMHGYYTGLVLFADDRCARCQVCLTAASRGAEVPANHIDKCTNTWSEGEGSKKHETLFYMWPNITCFPGATRKQGHLRAKLRGTARRREERL